MRALLFLSLLTLPLSVLAARGDPIICDPPPSTSPDCPAGLTKLYYFDALVFSDETPEMSPTDMCASSSTSASFVRVCESEKVAPRTQLICEEDEDHAVTCEASPRSGGELIYLWEAKNRVITADAQTDVGARVTSFACKRDGYGSISLTITKASGATTKATSDVRCSGVYAPRHPR